MLESESVSQEGTLMMYKQRDRGIVQIIVAPWELVEQVSASQGATERKKNINIETSTYCICGNPNKYGCYM